MPTLPLTRLRTNRTTPQLIRYSIGITGCEAKDCPTSAMLAARSVGQSLAELDQTVVVTVADGVPYAAAEAAKSHGGVVVGFATAASSREQRHLTKLPDEPYTSSIYCGMDYDSCTQLLLRSCQAIIFIVGHSGNWPELAVPIHEDMLVGVLTTPTHLTAEVAHIVSMAKGNVHGIIYESDQRVLVGRVLASLHRRQASGKL